MKKTEQLYEGKAKKVFLTDDPDYVIVEYKDDATAFNGLKKGSIKGKGVVNNKVSNHLFRMLESKGIPTHYVREVNDHRKESTDRAHRGHRKEYRNGQPDQTPGYPGGHGTVPRGFGVQL